MSRREQLSAIFKNADKELLIIVDPLIEELCFVENQLTELKKLPLIRVNPKNPAMQKQTDAGKLYKDLLAKQTDIIRTLCSQLHKVGEAKEDSPLREYLRKLVDE